MFEQCLCFSGNVIQLIDLTTGSHQYVRSSSGMGLGHIAVHPSQKYFAVGEKGINPNIFVFAFPSLRLFRTLRKGTLEAYAHLTFNPKGNYIASVGSNPDYQLTVWDWKNESTILRTKVRSFFFSFHSLPFNFIAIRPSQAMFGVSRSQLRWRAC